MAKNKTQHSQTYGEKLVAKLEKTIDQLQKVHNSDSIHAAAVVNRSKIQSPIDLQELRVLTDHLWETIQDERAKNAELEARMKEINKASTNWLHSYTEKSSNLEQAQMKSYQAREKLIELKKAQHVFQHAQTEAGR